MPSLKSSFPLQFFFWLYLFNGRFVLFHIFMKNLHNIEFSFISCWSYLNSELVIGNGRGNIPSRELEKLLLKMMLFSKALFFSTPFPKIVKNSIFLLNFYFKKFTSFSKCPKICIFRPNPRKITRDLLRLLEKLAKIMQFCNCLTNFWKTFENSPASWVLRSQDAEVWFYQANFMNSFPSIACCSSGVPSISVRG